MAMLCGDFNAHSPMWGALDSNYLGNQLSVAIYEEGLILPNDSVLNFDHTLGA